MDQIRIVDYTDAYRGDFKRLNLAWIERWFTVEPHDLEQLDHPNEHILAGGGRIFVALYEGKAIGVCALISTGDNVYELAKMAVDPPAQSRGVGKQIGEAAIAWARENGASTIWLESNRRLTTALRLYARLGFREVFLETTPYARADIKMEMALTIEEGKPEHASTD